MKENKILKNSLRKLVNRFGREDFVSAILKNSPKETIQNISMNDIVDNHYLKKAKLDENKIKTTEGQLENNVYLDPIILRSYKDKYEVVVGRIKFYAAKHLKKEKINSVVLSLSDEESLLLMLKEMTDRKAMNMYELALICSHLKTDFKYKNKELSDFLNQSPSQISNLLQILNLPESVLVDISMNKLSYGHAKAISRLDKEDVLNLVSKIYESSLSVRETEELVRNLKGVEVNHRQHKNDLATSDIETKEEIKKEIVDESPLRIDNLSLTLRFKDEKALNEGLKRINKLIKKKKIVLK